MTTETQDNGSVSTDPNSDPEAWQSLDRDSQDEILQQRLDDESAGSFDTLPPEEQRDTLAALEGKMEETWWATVLGDVPLEFRTLTEAEQEQLMDKAQSVFRVVEADDDGQMPQSADDLDSDVLEGLDELAEWLPDFLARVSADSRMDREWWEDGDYPQGFKLESFLALFERVTNQMEQTGSFRQK